MNQESFVVSLSGPDVVHPYKCFSSREAAQNFAKAEVDDIRADRAALYRVEASDAPAAIEAVKHGNFLPIQWFDRPPTKRDEEIAREKFFEELEAQGSDALLNHLSDYLSREKS